MSSRRDGEARRRELEKILRAATPLLLESYSPAPGSDAARWQRLGVETKKNHSDLVTIYDKRVEEFLLERLATTFPGEPCVGEELTAAGKKTPREQCEKHSGYWVIDPIDGTTNFSRSFPFFCSTAAWVEQDAHKRHVPQVGAVWDPVRREMFSASKGGGAWLNRIRLSVTSIQDPKEALLITGFATARDSSDREPFERFADITLMTLGVRRLGSAALDLSHVACGRTDGYWERGLSPWDVAAGALLVEEAGGLVTRHDGAPLDILEGEILSSNAFLHKWLQSKLKVVLKN